MDVDSDPEWLESGPEGKEVAGTRVKPCVPSKQTGSIKVCIIHHESVKDDDNLISPRDHKSWTTILNAAKIRQYSAITDLESTLEENEVPDIEYHRDCRSLFTMKRDLETLSKESKETVRESPSKFHLSSRGLSRRSSIVGPSIVYYAICIFCERKSKYKKKSRTKEPLIKCSELRGDDSVRRAAVFKKDQRILALASRELVAAEAHYHKTCYLNYTRCLSESNKGGDKGDSDTETAMESEDIKSYDEIENEASLLFSEWMRQEVFPSHSVVNMSRLYEQHACTMKSLGITEIKPSTQKHFRRKLEKEFGDVIRISHDDKGRLLVMPSNITVHDLAMTNQRLMKELDEKRDADDSTDLVKQVAQILRADIKANEVEREWPPSLNDIEGYKIQSKLTKNFLTILLTGNTKDTDQSDRIQRLVNSFAQDLIYAISAGTIKTPKHILLSFAVKTLTGNAELIRMLNRLGHVVSYPQVEEIDTALCMQKLARAENEGAALPANIKPYVQTTFAWDNIDRLEETLKWHCCTSKSIWTRATKTRCVCAEEQKKDN